MTHRFPHAVDCQLYPHQRVGVEWLAEHPRALLADEQGLGKTVTALRAAARLSARRILVVAPAVVTWNWSKEAHHWLELPRSAVQVIRTGRCTVSLTAQVVIVSHTLMTRAAVKGQLLNRHWDVLVVDEAHAFRNPDTQRTRALYGHEREPHVPALVRCAGVVWLLTGTPMPNNAAELWTHMWGLDGDRLTQEDGTPMSFHAFRGRFCHTATRRYHRATKLVVTGNRTERLPELRNRLDGFILRRRKSDELDLPPMRWESIALRPDKLESRLQALEEELGAEVVDMLLQDTEDPEEVFQALKDAHGITAYRRLCGLAKAPEVAELLRQELDSGQLGKVVVFAWHTCVLDLLEEELGEYRVRRIDGTTSQARRQTAVEDFQEDPTVRVMLCNIQAGGVGITLTAASEAVFAELSWVPGDNAQAADRIHRIGQESHSIRCRFVSLAGTADELVTEVLRRKVRMIREVLEQ